MKFFLVLTSGLLAQCAVAFQTATLPTVSRRVSPLSVGTAMGTIDLQDTAQRDVPGMEEWARNCGVQTAPGVELTSQDGQDWSVLTRENLGAGSPVLFVPAQMILSSGQVEQEYGGALQQAEQILAANTGTAQRLPLFRLMVKLLVEFERGQESPYFPWLNSLPRRFYNGVSMTDACFDCLPPYAGWLASTERNSYSVFVNALRKGYLPINPQIVNDDNICKWAYNVALTRFQEVWEPRREKKIAPMADMFNHGANANVAITFDPQGNCQANTLYDVPAGTPLTISYGDPTNPTPIFAKFGFLPNDCATIFCKAMHLKREIDDLGYDFKDLLFQVQSGDIAPKVWDIFLYRILQQNDQNAAQQFYVACKTNDEAAKQQTHGQFFQYTLQAMREHVDSILRDTEVLTQKAYSYDVNTHPRVPVIVAHNELVKQTFSNVKRQLDAMG